jgi:hypothetical protein
MPGNPRPWNSTAWEEHIQRLLKKRYANPPGSYQHIPATTHGDYGLEGYAVDGTGYQCYAAQDWSNTKQLYEKQRNKITRDIGTFIRNETDLLKILGTIRIATWNFVVPYWADKQLLVHAKDQEERVKKGNLRHVTNDFRVAIITEDDFATEAQLLANLKLHQFDVPAPLISPSDLDSWMRDKINLEVVANLSRKAGLIATGKSKEAREKFQARIVAHYISGNTMLARLQQDLPETYLRILEYKVAREANLEAETYITTKVPAEFLEHTLQEYRSELLEVPGISPRVAATLAQEAVSDWLLRCPMDF